MSRPTPTRGRRRLLALVLAAVAIGLVVVEPFPSGQVLLSLTDTHGIDAGDIPALAMLLIAACLAVSSSVAQTAANGVSELLIFAGQK